MAQKVRHLIITRQITGTKKNTKWSRKFLLLVKYFPGARYRSTKKQNHSVQLYYCLFLCDENNHRKSFCECQGHESFPPPRSSVPVTSKRPSSSISSSSSSSISSGFCGECVKQGLYRVV